MRIAIAGVGGIGSFLVPLLFDLGNVRNQFPYSEHSWTIYEKDVVEVPNLLHQNFKEEDLGKDKGEVLQERVYSTMCLETRFMTDADFPKHDLVFCCVDSMTFRKQLYEFGWEEPKLFWIDGRCSSRQIGVYHSRLARKTIECDLTDSKERLGCLRAVDKENKLSHVTPQIVAGMMAQTFLNYLRNELQPAKIVMMI